MTTNETSYDKRKYFVPNYGVCGLYAIEASIDEKEDSVGHLVGLTINNLL